MRQGRYTIAEGLKVEISILRREKVGSKYPILS